MTDLAVIILVRNEERHIRRCLDRLLPLAPREIFLVDSESTDATSERIESFRAEALAPLPEGDRPALVRVVHPYPGNQAAQFQWALDNLPIESTWILRLDADEYLSSELISEIAARLPGATFDGAVLRRRHVVGWLGDTWVRRGMYPTCILRLFRRGKGRSDLKLMDEHVLVDGPVVTFEGDFTDHSLITFDEWRAKHRAYAVREAESHLAGERSSGSKSLVKRLYYRLPPYVRPTVYFLYRLLVRGALWEGPAAWRWCWYHAFWYRVLVDREIAARRRIVRRAGRFAQRGGHDGDANRIDTNGKVTE